MSISVGDFKNLARAGYEARFPKRGPRGDAPEWDGLNEATKRIWYRVAIIIVLEFLDFPVEQIEIEIIKGDLESEQTNERPRSGVEKDPR